MQAETRRSGFAHFLIATSRVLRRESRRLLESLAGDFLAFSFARLKSGATRATASRNSGLQPMKRARANALGGRQPGRSTQTFSDGSSITFTTVDGARHGEATEIFGDGPMRVELLGDGRYPPERF